MMRLKPLRFIGHKIGPFEHIELNWEKDSRYTLIVAENGMGKTTLVAAIAACLSLGDDNLFPFAHFQRFAHDEKAFAYLELDIEGETGWIVHWASGNFEDPLFNPSDPYSDFPYNVFKLQDGRLHPAKSPPKHRTLQLPGSLTLNLEKAFYVDSAPGRSVILPAVCSWNLLPFIKTRRAVENINALTAAYGVNRDIQHTQVQEYKELEQNPLKDILNPFAPIQSSENFQWIANQHVNYALALAENKAEEAKAYLAAIRRIEQVFNKGLQFPMTFQVKRNPFRLDIQQNGTTLSVDQLSDGARNFLSWPLDYLMRASRVNWDNPADSAAVPGLILVDEIDSHLHPEWQRRVIQIVSDLLPETYLIATTHSPFVVGAADDAQVFRIYEDESGQLAVSASFDELYGYPADLVLEKTFVPSLYAPEFEQKLQRLSTLAAKVASDEIVSSEKQEHNKLLQELAKVNPWLDNLLTLSQTTRDLPV